MGSTATALDGKLYQLFTKTLNELKAEIEDPQFPIDFRANLKQAVSASRKFCLCKQTRTKQKALEQAVKDKDETEKDKVVFVCYFGGFCL